MIGLWVVDAKLTPELFTMDDVKQVKCVHDE